MVGSEDPVDATGVEPQHAESTLQLSDVVAPLHRAAQVQQPVTELVAGFDDRGPRLEVADAIGLEATCDLERAHGGLGGRAVAAVLSLARIEASPGQPALKVA